MSGLEAREVKGGGLNEKQTVSGAGRAVEKTHVLIFLL